MINKTVILLFSLALSSVLCQHSIASDSHDHQAHAHEGEHDEHEDGTTEIHQDMAMQVGIKSAIVGPQSLRQTITSYGRLTTGPEQTSHVRARFAGVITSVDVTIGDQVKTGDLLAVVESNESLKKYELRAPISGTVVQRHANTGEMTQEQVLFSIANSDALWAELRIFPSQQKLLAAGQLVSVDTGEQDYQATIAHLLPAEGGAPYLIARAQLSNSKGDLFPGLMVEGRIVISEFNAVLAVQNIGLQMMGGQRGVFIKHDEAYSFAPLVLGRSDDVFSEVLSGISAGFEYVTNNSFLIKADIEKSEAEHVH